ncbi:Protein of unknown function [Pilibacter termitis]|uniref:DUF262 domain-containing protein n=1 Tax=Pilibacter termitis TaxID=263852 RepID=A0A1T4PBK3_9ENTE|nr:DUF262 domain-containing protein [Pilibacter termitis]SJZ88761.1 Protein of unknown function [Pilibacter termitis]
MEFNNADIETFFSSKSVKYTIPVYQRAYAWQKQEWQTFLEDLKESLQGENQYFYGNILLEKINSSNKEFDIIDGQQRLTTVIIFIRAVINVLSEKETELSVEKFDREEIKKNYLIYQKRIKFIPVEYDSTAWEAIIVRNDGQFKPESTSQRRYVECKVFFEEELRKLTTEEILALFYKLQASEVNIITLSGKKESSLMFELQNNRGKELTNLEKIKAFFMYKIYSNTSADETENLIEGLSRTFEEIYRTLSYIAILNEDQVLRYHNQAYLNGYAYRNIDDVKDELLKSENPVNWIGEYSTNLLKSFKYIKEFEQDTIEEKRNLEKLGIPAWTWPFIMKGYQYYSNPLPQRREYLQLLEKIAFRDKLISTRAKFEDRLNPILKNFKGDFQNLSLSIKEMLGESCYWANYRFNEVLNGSYQLTSNTQAQLLRYIFWEYEKFIQNKGYSINEVELENEEIEHISPQTEPTDKNKSSGYDLNEKGLYDDEFKEKYLNSIGNLLLISKSHNASIGNKPFSEKLNSYRNNPLLNQQAEIKDYVDDLERPVWKREQITKRGKAIIDFVLKRWKIG